MSQYRITAEEREDLRKARQARSAINKRAKAARPKHVPAAKGQRQPRVRDPGYLQWIRRLPCVCSLLPGHEPCEGPVQAAHVRYSDGGRRNPGMQQKPSDRLTTPLCARHHALQHTGSERTFWSNRGIDPGRLCAELSRAYDADRDGASVIQAFASEARL